MEQDSTRAETDGTALFAGEAWFDPIEAGVRDRVRGFIGELLEQELTQALGRSRHERAGAKPSGYRNGTGTMPQSSPPWREESLLTGGPAARHGAAWPPFMLAAWRATSASAPPFPSPAG